MCEEKMTQPDLNHATMNHAFAQPGAMKAHRCCFLEREAECVGCGGKAPWAGRCSGLPVAAEMKLGASQIV